MKRHGYVNFPVTFAVFCHGYAGAFILWKRVVQWLNTSYCIDKYILKENPTLLKQKDIL